MLSKKPLIAYCDYIAYLIQSNIKALDTESEKLLSAVSRIQFDIGANNEYCSTAKTIDVEDRFGKQYRITIQEL